MCVDCTRVRDLTFTCIIEFSESWFCLVESGQRLLPNISCTIPSHFVGGCLQLLLFGISGKQKQKKNRVKMSYEIVITIVKSSCNCD